MASTGARIPRRAQLRRRAWLAAMWWWGGHRLGCAHNMPDCPPCWGWKAFHAQAFRSCFATLPAARVAEVKAGRVPAALWCRRVRHACVELVVLSLVPQVKRGMPLLPANCIERGELCAGLDAAAAVGSTLVCAPPGLGKTLLLTEWAIRPRPVETAWVTFDGGDNDPRHLWASVLAALARRTSLQPSNSVPSSLAWSAAEHIEFVSELVDQLHSLPSPIRLILDDVDELTDPEALRGLPILTGNVSSRVHLVLSGQVRAAVRAASTAAVWPAPCRRADAASDILPGWLEHRSRRSRIHPFRMRSVHLPARDHL